MERPKDKGSGTRHAWKCVGASVLLHVASAMVALFAIPGVPRFRTPLVIDLTIGGPWGPGDPAAPAPARESSSTSGAIRQQSPPAIPPLPAPVTPEPAAMPGTRPPDRQTEAAAPRPSEPAGGNERTSASHGSAAVSGDPGSTAPAVAGFPQGGSTARATTGAGADAEEPGEARANARGRYLERNYAYIRDAIQQGIAYPVMARRMGWEGKVVVTFLVLSDGSVRNVRVVQGSGHPALDRGAVEAVRNAAPFPRPPAEAVIVTPVVYRLE
ncbi:MAG: outer rane transport energization protein TonB [Deltaproteobacteria bacterium]|nr:outer rane transport energization protein TonB [Deltaproteobacteria bacterium]